ncbi:NUDIX domain-containing protein [Persicirhabdus sediminis]|uniref:NUDIX domain-containing protein n=1 Tax=Persicirhabdus sediminis TaxID=454144 RepID=A0A8J7MAT3_9BACT|nr:NUDIX domain-containing protein [Persicirhabdus sediminis]MBK1789623.1 NUDIX domain-containing protein [Persicirhabdus sediminis]
MSKYAGEQILVIPRPLFDDLGSFQGTNADIDKYLPVILNPENNFFMDRAAAEEDPTHKQLIPYAIFKAGDKFLHYRRGKSGGEARLHAAGSVGIGGHINPIDERTDHLGEATYMAGVEREIEEELNISGSHSQKIIALLNDDSNEVGKVHLGVVHLFELENDQVTANEDAIAELQFLTLEQLQGEYYESLESWSQKCVDALAQL